MIKISKGLDLPISGSPTNTISDEPKVSSVALLSNDFIGMKPTMLVKEGETIKALISEIDLEKGRIGLNTALLENSAGELIVDKEIVMREAKERALKTKALFDKKEL